MHRNKNEETFKSECIVIQMQSNCALSVDIFNTYCWVYKLNINKKCQKITSQRTGYSVNLKESKKKWHGTKAMYL